MKSFSVAALTKSEFYLSLRGKYLKWEEKILQAYPPEPSYERRVGRHLLNLTLVISLIAIINRLIHPFEGNVGIDLLWEAIVSVIWFSNILLIKKKKISLVIFLYFLCNTIIFFVHFIIKDFYATDLTFVHPYHVFEVATIILVCCIFVSFKFVSAKWILLMAAYGSIILGLHGYAISQHYPVSLVINLTSIAIFALFVGLVALHFTAGFLHRQRATIETQQHEIKEKNRELANRIKDLKNFTYIASHDLKTPLRTIISFQDLLKKKLTEFDDEAMLSYLAYAHNGAKDLESLLNDLLTYTHLTHHEAKGCFETVDLSRIISDIKKESVHIIMPSHKVCIQEPLPEVYTVEPYIKIILQNLICNGLKYNQKKVPQVTISGKKQDGKVRISVADNGIGIHKNYLGKIFFPFQRLHSQEEYEGRGFGLTLTKHLIEKLNGEIEVISEPGKGSVFTAVLEEPA